MAARIYHPNGNEPVQLVMPEEVHQVLGRILKSKHFANAPKKQKFLHLICDYYLNGQASELNEYLIGRDVFDRDDHYNPAADPIVRVGAHDIRKKLDLYYQNEGAADTLRLVVPVGSYEPIFVRQLTPPILEPAPEPLLSDQGKERIDSLETQSNESVIAPISGSLPKFWVWAGSTMVVLLVSIVSFLFIANRQTPTSTGTTCAIAARFADGAKPSLGPLSKRHVAKFAYLKQSGCLSLC